MGPVEDKVRQLKPDTTNMFKMLIGAGTVSQAQNGPAL
jgi:hypothetical protein